MLLEGEMDWARSNIGRAALHRSAVKTTIPAAWGVSLAKARSVLSSNTEIEKSEIEIRSGEEDEA
jgi:hypothetical protein